MNLNVIYQGPVPCLSVLTSELRATFGNPARTYEYVTGYDHTGVTSHNADNNGRVHAVDIFVGPGNLTEAQGIWVAEQLRKEGERGSIPGHPDRLAYIIHRGRIAGDHTGWQWWAYNGVDWHGDHIHVSASFDYAWGDPVSGNPADFNSTIPWNLGAPTNQGSGVKPLPLEKEDELSKEAETRIMAGIASMEAGIRKNLNDHFLYGTNASDGWRPGVTKITIENQRRLNAANTKLAAMESVVAQLAKGQGVVIDYAKIEKAIQKALADGIEITGTIEAK